MAIRFSAVSVERILDRLRDGWPAINRRRDRILLGLSATAILGIVVLLGGVTWLLWDESIRAEERWLTEQAEALGTRADEMIVDARDMLDRLNASDAPRCSDEHLQAMHGHAIDQPHIRAIGYWRAAERECGIGFIQGIDLRPPEADRIYDSGVIAWWPGPQTEVAGTELFLMRFGSHDVAIDPQGLLEAGPLGARRVGLWVEGMRMAARPADADLPQPADLPGGLTVDGENQRIAARFTLDTVFPIDIVAVEPMEAFWGRYWDTLALVGGGAVVLAVVWVYGAFRYSRHRLSLTAELREALDNNRLTVRYQPVIDLTTGHCVGAEALARWVRDNGEEVSPETFLPLAEKTGLVSRVTLAVLDTTLRELGPLLHEDPELRISLNLAPEDLETEAFSRELVERMRAAGIPASSIKLEITERALINSDAARQLIGGLRERGHEVAIDDFGTGYSSLAYLESFELDTLKIDKSFVDAIDREAVTSSVISHVIDMAKSLELDMTAEGIENERQAVWLAAQGVHYAQGYLYSKPLSARRLREFIRETGVDSSNVYALRDA